MQQTIDPTIQLARAYNFAASRHANQRRKGADAEPYINHLIEVADFVAEASNGDVAVVIAAVLHDAVEDAGVTLVEIEAEFGADVADPVAEVTDDKMLPKQVRKNLQIEHAPHASLRTKLIKMADKISNLRSLTGSPPADWDAERIVEYCRWAKLVVDGCRGAHIGLSHKFDEAHKRAAASQL